MKKEKVRRKKVDVPAKGAVPAAQAPDDAGVPACDTGTSGEAGIDLRTAEEKAADAIRAACPLWLPQRATGKLIPILGDIEIPGEKSSQRSNRLAKEANARADEEQRKEMATWKPSRSNPLFGLPEDRAQKLFTWLRECPYHDAVKAMLAEQGIADVTDRELEEFFESEATAHWQRRLSRAATEANALVTYIETHPVKFSAGILAALGQEAFRQIASGEVSPEAMGRMTNLFLKARADERSDHILELRREKLALERRTQTEAALEAFAAEIEKDPAAREAFEKLRLELLRKEGE